MSEVKVWVGRAPSKGSTGARFLASSSFRWRHHSRLCVHAQLPSLSVSLCVLSSSYKDACPWI